MENRRHKKTAMLIRLLMKIFPLLLLALVVLLFTKLFRNVSVDDIIKYTPENYWLAAAVFIAAYAVKSFSIFFPLLILYIASGIVFPPLGAVLVNISGLLICVSVPYCLGHYFGQDWVGTLTKKYKKAETIETLLTGNEWFISYILRVINLLPGDLVSMVLGAAGIRYYKFLFGSVIGLFPTMIAATFLGDTITDPASPGFIISFAATIIISLISITTYYIVIKKKN